MMDCHVQGTMKITPFYQVAFIQTHTVTRFHNLVVYRTAIFGRLIDNPPCFFVAGQSEGNLYIIIHLKNRNPGRGNGEDNLCSFSRVNCVIGDPVRLYFWSPHVIFGFIVYHCVECFFQKNKFSKFLDKQC